MQRDWLLDAFFGFPSEKVCHPVVWILSSPLHD